MRREVKDVFSNMEEAYRKKKWDIHNILAWELWLISGMTPHSMSVLKNVFCADAMCFAGSVWGGGGGGGFCFSCILRQLA